MVMTVSSLRPGTAFRIDLGRGQHLDYRLIYANDCRAYVEPMMRKKKTIARKDDVSDLTGEPVVLAEFEAPGGKVNIAPGTIVDELLEAAPMDEDDDLTGAAPTKPAIKPVVHQKRGDRHFDPTPQTRPVRPNTTRAEMLDALLKGEKSVAALAKKFGQKTSLTIAHIRELWKCHGYGYSIRDDKITITPPLPQNDDISDLL